MLFDDQRENRADRALRILEISDAPLWFIGDLHGDLLALEAALALIDRESEREGHGPARIVLLGDLFDDGGYGLETLLRVFELMLRRSSHLCLRRRQSRRGPRLQRFALHGDRVAIGFFGLPQRESRARVDRPCRKARRQNRGRRAAGVVLSRRPARRAWRLSAPRSPRAPCPERQLERSAVSARFRLGPRAPAGEEEAAEPVVAREPVRLRGLRGVLRIERDARPARDAHDPRPRSRGGALRDLPCLCQDAGADDRRAVAQARARDVWAVRSRPHCRPLDPRIAAAGVPASYSRGAHPALLSRGAAKRSRPRSRVRHERRSAVSDLRDNAGRCGGVRGVLRR